MEKKTKASVRVGMLSWLILPGFLLYLAIQLLAAATPLSAFQLKTAQASVTPEPMIEIPANPAPVYAAYPWKNTGLVTLWFDNAWRSQYQIAYPILQASNLTAAISVPTAQVGYPAYMSWNNIQTLQSSGWEVTSLGRNPVCSIGAFSEQEVAGSQLDLVRRGLTADQYVAPCGVNSQEITYNLSLHFDSQRLTEPGLNKLPIDDQFALRSYVITNETVPSQVEAWLKQAKKEKRWIILTINSIGPSADRYVINEGMLREVIEKVKASKLPVVRPSEVLKIGREASLNE